MDEQLRPGTRMKTTYGGHELTVQSHIGSGGQGDVYAIDYQGQPMALKWYKPESLGKRPRAFYDNLLANIRRGAPGEGFLWPKDITGWSNGTFGYVMDLRPDGYHDVTEFMLTRVRFGSFKSVADAALHIVSAFRTLHNAGYCYQDLNDGNFFINPRDGRVLICDNDNVAPNGVSTGMLGKPRYMAPEIVVGQRRAEQAHDPSLLRLPDYQSDLFSMAVVLYILLCLNHPLEGRRSLTPAMTPELQYRLYGSEPLFVMDPDDRSNAPHRRVHANTLAVWGQLPDYMRDIFLQAFGKRALRDPNARPQEVDWMRAFVRFRSDVVPCACGNEVFTQGGTSRRCERCGAELDVPYRLELAGAYDLCGVDGTRVYRCQCGVCDADEALDPVARVVSRQGDPGRLGIRNLGKESWGAITSTGQARRVAPGETVPLKDGITLAAHDRTIRIHGN